MTSSVLKPAAELASTNTSRIPNESAEYRRARQALLVEEIELRRHIERVAELRRALPPGGEVTTAYEFIGESRSRPRSASLFGNKQTPDHLQLHVRPAAREAVSDVHLRSWARGRRSCPISSSASRSCSWRGSPIARLVEAKRARGWTRHRVYSGHVGRLRADYVSKDDGDVPGYNVFTRARRHDPPFLGWRDGGRGTMDPGQDPRGAPDLDPLWTVLDTTREGRGTDWYPKLSY